MPEHKVEVIFKAEREDEEDRVEILPFADEVVARMFAAHKGGMSNVESARYIEPEGRVVEAPKPVQYAPPHPRCRLLRKVHKVGAQS